MAAEGMICPWRGTNSQVGAASGLLLIVFSVLIGCLLGGGRPLFSPLGGIFHSLILSRLLTACFLSRGSDLEAVQGFLCSSVAQFPRTSPPAFICHVSVAYFWFFLLCGGNIVASAPPPFFSPPCLFEHTRFPGKMEEVCRRREEKKHVLKGSPHSEVTDVALYSFFLPPSSSAFFHSSLGVKTGKECVWTAPLLSLVALIPLLPSVSPSFSQQRGRDKPYCSQDGNYTKKTPHFLCLFGSCCHCSIYF